MSGAASAKIELKTLEKEGQYVFHGSPDEVEEFEPRQAYNYHENFQEPDGAPAVFASSSAEYAILMAIINKKNCPEGFQSSAGVENGILTFRATQSTLDQLSDKSFGWVHVFYKNLFEQRNEGSVEYVSYAPVRAIKKIQVSSRDLPDISTLK